MTTLFRDNSIPSKDTNENHLHLVVEAGSLKQVTHLIQAGISVNEKDVYGWTPIHYAILKKNLQMVQLLLQNGAELTISSIAYAQSYLARIYRILQYVFIVGGWIPVMVQNIYIKNVIGRFAYTALLLYLVLPFCTSMTIDIEKVVWRSVVRHFSVMKVVNSPYSLIVPPLLFVTVCMAIWIPFWHTWFNAVWAVQLHIVTIIVSVPMRGLYFWHNDCIKYADDIKTVSKMRIG